MSQSTLRILAVDNEPSVTFSLSHILNAPRYDLTAVENGDAALARIDAGAAPFDLIIVDQKMPHMSGVETKIMVLSAHISHEIREAYERMDVHVMFPKPFDVAALRSAVDRMAA